MVRTPNRRGTKREIVQIGFDPRREIAGIVLNRWAEQILGLVYAV
jgi:hypothetical protein